MAIGNPGTCVRRWFPADRDRSALRTGRMAIRGDRPRRTCRVSPEKVLAFAVDGQFASLAAGVWWVSSSLSVFGSGFHPGVVRAQSHLSTGRHRLEYKG